MEHTSQNLVETKLTGNYYFKPTWLGIVAVVETRDIYSDGYTVTEFKKAKITDLFNLGLLSAPLNKITNG